MKVYITKYALTRGIIEVSDAEVDTDGNARLPIAGTTLRQFIRSPWVHRTIEEAQANRLEMRDAKIKSLRRQIAKLESWKPEVAK